jgi:peptidyl-prolyl cis-trans isomerase C
MLRQSFTLPVAAALLLAGAAVFAQTPPPPATPAAPAAPAANAVAATVNNQPIYETAIQRFLAQRRVPADKVAVARAAFLDLLIDNVLIEQYLQQLQIAIDPKEVETKVTNEREKMNLKKKEDWDRWLQTMQMSEAEVMQEATADMRWHKYLYSVAPEKTLREFFEANKEMFDGTQVRARHILVTPPSNDPKQCEEAIAKLRNFKQAMERQVADALQQLPGDTKPLDREKKRIEVLERTFSDLAAHNSACPSAKDGGDVGFFPRAGSFVEPFAKAAFALKMYELSDVVKTDFGYHLILVTDRVGTHDVKFEEVKDSVLEVYGEQLHQAMVTQAKQKSKIEIMPAPKP